MTERLVVIGGDAAGMSAASQARKRRDASELEIVAFERGQHTSYSACGIPYWISGVVDDLDDLIARRPHEFREKHDIDVRTGHEVVGIDLAAASVSVRGPDDRVAEHGYDQLMIATGAVPIRPPIPNIDADGVLGVQTLEDGERVLEALRERRPERAVVVGAGYIGLEMAEAMVVRGIDVALVDRGGRPMSTMDDDMGDRIADAMRGMGIDLHLDTEVEGIEIGADGWVRTVATGAGDLPADLVVLGTGTRPGSDLAAGAGVPVGDAGGVLTDRQQRSRAPGVWAAGDCTEVFHRVARRSTAIALGTIANKQGRVAGINLGGGYATFPGVLGTAVTKVCGLEISRTGLGETEARAAGFEPVCSTIRSTTRAHYYPGGAWATIKVIAEHRSGRLLGAQIVSEEGGAKRIDVFAMALWNGITVRELLNVDLSYAPPFSPTWDPVLIAARKAWDAVEEQRG